MNRLLASVAGMALALSYSTAYAGGPIIVEEEGQPEVVAEAPRSGWIVPVVVGLVVLCAIACGGDDDPVDDGGGDDGGGDDGTGGAP